VTGPAAAGAAAAPAKDTHTTMATRMRVMGRTCMRVTTVC